jgi:hypothetical protein
MLGHAYKQFKAFKMIVGGLGAAAFGVWLFVDALESRLPGEPPVDTNILWTGPLIVLLGLAVAWFGLMILNEK